MQNVFRVLTLLALLLLATTCQKEAAEPVVLPAEGGEQVAFRDFTADQLYEILDAMELNINAWIDAGELNAAIGGSLLSKLAYIRSMVDAGQLDRAERTLDRSFMHYVDRLHDEGNLTDSQHQSLDDMAHGILPDEDEGSVSDPNGKAYPWKRMADGKKWITVNLDYWDGEDGDAGHFGQTWPYDGTTSEPDPGYGMLYTYDAALTACEKAFGAGWRMPGKSDWDNLILQYDPNWNMGDLSFSSSAPYENLILGGSSGFNALLGGFRSINGGYYNLGVDAIYWSGTERDAQFSWYYDFYSRSGELKRYYIGKSLGLSCRCLQD